MILPSKKTKIIATIGPATQEVSQLVELIHSGMNVARINFAHGDYATHAATIANVRSAASQTGRRVAIMGDLPGPKMRIGELAEEPVILERGQPFTLQTTPTMGDRFHASLDFDALTEAFSPGDRIFMNDGYLQLEVNRIEADAVHCTVVVGGELRSRKGVNFPGIDLGISAFTEHDRELLAFCAEQKLDAVSLSFVKGPMDIEAARQAATAPTTTP
ncbi:MAG: pyruvate kinase [Caldilineaceae bacterium]